MKRFLAFACLALMVPARAEYGLTQSKLLGVGISDSRVTSNFLAYASETDDPKAPCLIETKNPVSGAQMSLSFGSERGSESICYTSLLAFNTLGESVFLDSSVFEFASNAYLHPERVNRVSFFDSQGTLKVTHNLPPLTSAYFNSANAYKLFNGSGVFAFPLHREKAVPAHYQELFRNSLDGDHQKEITTEVVLAIATREAGIKVLDHPSICGAVGCSDMQIFSALDGGKIWLTVFRGASNGHTELASGWVDTTSGVFNRVDLPSPGQDFEPASLESVNERGDMLLSAYPVKRHGILLARKHVFTVDAQSRATQDLSCQISYDDSDNQGAAFIGEDTLELHSVSRDHLNVGEPSEIHTSNVFKRGTALAPLTCAKLDVHFSKECRGKLELRVRSRLMEGGRKAKQLQTESYVCGGYVRAIDTQGKVIKNTAFTLKARTEKSVENREHQIVSQRDSNSYRWINTDKQGLAHFKIRVPTYSVADSLYADIQGPLSEPYSLEQQSFSLDAKLKKD